MAGQMKQIALAMAGATAARGIMMVRSDVSSADKILAELQKTFSQFQETHAEQVKGINAKFDDVVTKEKLDKVNAQVGDLQAALDKAVQQVAALELGGAGPDKDRVKDREYTAAFKAHIRKGDVQASLNKGVDAEGGYLAPREWDRTITDKLVILTAMRGLATVQTIGGNGFNKLFNLRGTASGWVGETAARPETAGPTFGSMAFQTGELYANPAATQAMLDDAEIDLESWLAGEVDTEFAYQEGLAFISGTGANGRPNGILTYITGGANAAANPLGAITTVNSGHATSLTADGLVNLVHALPSAFLGNARFAMNKGTLNVARLLKDGDGNFLWQPSYQIGQPQTLLGYAVSDIPAMPALAASSKSVLFGDFARTYLIIDRIGTRVLRDPFTNKPFVMFYTTKRVGGGAQNTESMKALNTSA